MIYLAGTEVRVECDPGFQMMGNDMVTCQEDGSYDGELGVCIRNS